MKSFNCLIRLIISFSLVCISTTFHSEFALKNYEQLNYDEFKFESVRPKSSTHKKRSIQTDTLSDQLDLDSNRLTFNAYNRTFSLILKRGTNLLSDNFILEIRRSYPNKTTHVEIENENNHLRHNYFNGFVEDESSSSVLVYYESVDVNTTYKPLIYAQIRIKNTENNTIDYYYVEPLTNSSSPKYVIYKSEDVDSIVLSNGIFNSTVCRAKHVDEFDKDSKTSRSKRAAEKVDLKKKKRCSLALVADYKFYVNIGNRNVKQTQTYLTNIIERINDIYSRTEWIFDETENVDFNDRRNFGFVIEKIIVFETDNTNEPNHYNSDTSSKNSDTILQQFSQSEDWTKYCLAHLFTYQEFDNNVLGLAYVASPLWNAIGGICSLPTSFSKTSVNTGLSSYRSTNFVQKRLTQREAELVTAHEFGHNWGSEHDPLNDDCTPSAGSQGGNYLMYAYLNNGLERNNNDFSPCSINSISLVLKEKSHCFKEETFKLCGNSRVDEGEDCDGGERGLVGLDPCCDHKCKFKTHATCSDLNHDCCKNCMIASKGTMCTSNVNYLECFEDKSQCDGVSRTCPDYKPKPENTPCYSFDKGKCDALGHCLSLCQHTAKLEPCLCSKPEEKCMICCRQTLKDVNQTVCKPFHQIRASPYEYLSRGRPCIDGLCDEKNACVQRVKDYVSRFWKVIQKIDGNSFVEFMRRNIVGSIILISLIIWVPISCCVHFCIDKRDKAEQSQLIRAKIREYSQTRENQLLINN